MSKSLPCQSCGTIKHKVDDNVESITCHDCVLDLLQAYEEPIQKKQSAKLGYPKGWRFMKMFVHSDGTVYFRGVEQPQLKGQHEATTVVTKPKKTKQQKREEKQNALVEYNKLKKELKGENRKTFKKKIETKLKKLQKQL